MCDERSGRKIAWLTTVLGCRVIATASSQAKRDICVKKAGVDAAVDYTQKDWQVSDLAHHGPSRG